MTGSFNQGTSSGVTQNVATSIGQSYILSFYVGHIISSNGSGFYQGDAIADVSINGGARTSYTNSDVTTGTINWKQFSQSFVATTASTSITIFNGTTASNVNEVGLDNVQLTTATAPEAGSLVLILGVLPLAGVVFRRTRR